MYSHLSRFMVGRTGLEPANLPVPNRTLYQAELPPVACFALPELRRRLPSMAVRATHFTFRYFCGDSFPTKSLIKERRDIAPLRAPHVVKFKYDRVTYTAIDALSTGEELVQELPVHRPVPALVHQPALVVL